MPKKKSKVKKSPFAGYCRSCYMMLAEMDHKQPGYRCPSCNCYTDPEALLTKHPEAVVN
jgi:hypothetical protein